MASSEEHPPTFIERGSKRSLDASANVGGMPTQIEVYLPVGDLHCIQNVIEAGRLTRIPEEKEKGDERTQQVVVPPAKCAGPRECHTGSCKQIKDKIKHLAGEGTAPFKAEELEILVNQHNRDALVERAECLLLKNTEQHRALKAGLMRSDWLGALKEQEKWNHHMRELDKQREQYHWRIWEENSIKGLRREKEEKLRLQEKIRELKVCRLRHLEENKAKREKETAVSAEEARQLKARIEQESRKFAEDEQQKRTRCRQMHLEAMAWIARTKDVKRKEAAKLQEEEEAEAAFVEKRAPKLRLLEARTREMRQRQTELYSRSPAFQSPDYKATQEAQLRKDIEKAERYLPLREEETAQKKAEQQHTIAEERLRQQKMKMECRAKVAREDAAFVKQWREENAQALLMETQKKEERRQQFKETAATLQEQIAAVKEQRWRERDDEKNAVRAALSAIEKSEEAVGLLQLRCIQNALRNGNSHWPIVNSLRKYSASVGRLHHCNGRRRNPFNDRVGREESSEEN